MLPPFIIEQIRKREELQREDKRPVLELPLGQIIPPQRHPDHDGPCVSPAPDTEQKPQRGVIVLDL